MFARMLFIGALVLGSCAAQATTYVVTRFDDPSGATCTVSNCSLRAAAAAANAHIGSDTIRLSTGEYQLTLLTLFGPNSTLVVTDRLSIVGAGNSRTRIRQTRNFRVFTVQSTLLELDSLTVLDGHAQASTFPGNSGGCIYGDHSSITLRSSILANCVAGDLGGAAHLNGGRLTATAGSLIELNRAVRGGGVAMGDLDSTLVLDGASRVFRNDANTGGAVYSQTGTGNPDGSIAHPGVLTISADSSIDENDAPFGGALAVAFGKRLNVALASVDVTVPGAMARITNNNAANGAGGAVYSVGAVSLYRVRLSGNSSANGGAIYFNRGDPHGGCPVAFIGDSEIASNTATIDGGGLWGGEGNAYINNVSFNGNSAAGYGGAVSYRSGDGLDQYACVFPGVTMSNASVSNNTAQYGAGVSIVPDGQKLTFATLDILYSTFYNNHASQFQSASDVQVENRVINFSSAVTDNEVYTGSSIYSDGCFYDAFTIAHTTGGNRDVSPGFCVPGGGAGDQTLVSPGALGLSYASFGGPFPVAGFTLATSPAIGGGVGTCPTTDVRGAPRPSTGCDSGAFEFGATPL